MWPSRVCGWVILQPNAVLPSSTVFFHHLIRVTSITCDFSLYQWKSMFILCIDKWNESEKRFPKINTWYARNPVLFAPNCRKNCRNGYEDTIYLIFLYIRLKIMKFKAISCRKSGMFSFRSRKPGKKELLLKEFN